MPGGFLTPTQREAIQTRDDRYTRQLRSKIRKNVQDALDDFSLLLQHAEQRDLRQVAESAPSYEEMKEKHDKLEEELSEKRKDIDHVNDSLADAERRLENLRSKLREVTGITVSDEDPYATLVHVCEQLDTICGEIGITPQQSSLYFQEGNNSNGSVLDNTPTQIKQGLSAHGTEDDYGNLPAAIDEWREEIEQRIQQEKNDIEDEIEHLEEERAERLSSIGETQEELSELEELEGHHRISPDIREDLRNTMAVCMQMAALTRPSPDEAVEWLTVEAVRQMGIATYPEDVVTASIQISRQNREQLLQGVEKKINDSDNGDREPKIDSSLTDLEIRALHQDREANESDS